jgi:hypothetical protein
VSHELYEVAVDPGPLCVRWSVQAGMWKPGHVIAADGVYQQAVESKQSPYSPYFADQTRLYSQYGWDTVKYTDAQPAADPELRTYQVREDSRDCMNGGWHKFTNRAFASQAECVASLRRIS